MKKFLVCILLVLTIFLGVVTLVGCNPDEEEPFVAPSFDFTVPSDIPDYGLTIEWLDASGNTTTFKPNYPTVVVFTGKSTYDMKDSVNLDTANVYTASVTNSKTLTKTSYLWNKNGFNIGIFHCESFTDDTEDNVINKIFRSNMTYKKTVGTPNDEIVDYNLTEAFISCWLKVTSNPDDLSKGIGARTQEVRFIGNGTGAVLALSSAEYLDYLYENGVVNEGYLPDRIDLIDPYFSNKGIGYNPDFYPGSSIGSALAYSSKAVVELASKGTVFTLTESDEKFYDSYANDNEGARYSGISLETVGGTQKVVFEETEGTDSKYYLDIKKNVAYLNFRETFSALIPSEAYRNLNRSTLDWFLYTVNGSDDSSLQSHMTNNNLTYIPMLDGSDMLGTTVSQSVKWGVSSWTSTIYLRAVRGYEYFMQTYSSNKGREDYTMKTFQAENNQISNIIDIYGENMLYAVCGYAYRQADSGNYVSLNRSAQIAGHEINIIYKLNGKTQEVTVKTESDGFYMFNLGREYYGADVTISTATPSKDYGFVESDSAANNHLYYNQSIIPNEKGLSTTLSTATNQNFYLYFCNVGFELL